MDKRKVQDYKVIQETSATNLENTIKLHLADGWELHGVMIIKMIGQYEWYVQAMILPI